MISIGLLLGLALFGCDGSPPGGDDGGDAESVAADVWGGPIPEDASLREILQHPDPLRRAERIAQFLQSAGPEQLDDVRYEFETASHDRGDIEYALFGHWWARFDPQAAYYFADSQIRMEQPRVITEVLRTWAHMDPHGLVGSGTLTSAESQMRVIRPELVDSVVVGWFESGQPGLDDFVMSQTDSESRQFALDAWVRMKVLHEGDLATLEWTQIGPYHAEIKRQLLASALSLIAHQNPQLCIEWLEKAEESGVDVRNFVPRIANAWAHHDPRGAMEWVLESPETQERWRAISRIARKWRQRDVWGMQDWLDTQDLAIDQKSIGLLRYQALTAIVEQNDYVVDWNDLMRRAGLVSEINRRDIIVKWILQRWYVVDPEAAAAWAEENPYGVPEIVLRMGKTIEAEEREKIEAALGRATPS